MNRKQKQENTMQKENMAELTKIEKKLKGITGDLINLLDEANKNPKSNMDALFLISQATNQLINQQGSILPCGSSLLDAARL